MWERCPGSLLWCALTGVLLGVTCEWRSLFSWGRGGGTTFSSRASIAIAAAWLLAAPLALAESEPVSGKVVKVHDGDTITVESGGERFRCRLLGIDAPELSYAKLRGEMEKVCKYVPQGSRAELREAKKIFQKWAGVMESHAREARRALAEMVMGKTVLLAYDSKQPRHDSYGRLLVYVNLGETDVNAELIRRGLAVAEVLYPCDRLDEYVRLWRAAQAAGVGLWSARAGETEKAEPRRP